MDSNGGGWYCLPCNEKVLGDTEGPAAAQHLESGKHIQNVARIVCGAPSIMWHCVHCREWISEEQRVKHEGKSTHRSNARMRRKGGMWECDACNKIMFIDDKLQHSFGGKNLAAVLALSKSSAPEYKQPETSSSAPEYKQAETPIPKSTRGQKSSSRWNCVICDNKDLPLVGREGHIRGKRHRENRDSLEFKAILWRSANFGETVAHLTRDQSHLPKWSCSVCNKEMEWYDMERHLRGTSHQRVLLPMVALWEQMPNSSTTAHEDSFSTAWSRKIPASGVGYVSRSRGSKPPNPQSAQSHEATAAIDYSHLLQKGPSTAAESGYTETYVGASSSEAASNKPKPRDSTGIKRPASTLDYSWLKKIKRHEEVEHDCNKLIPEVKEEEDQEQVFYARGF